MWVVRTHITRIGRWTLRRGKGDWQDGQVERADEVKVLSNRRILIWRARRPFLYKGRALEPKHQHPNWILNLSTSHSLSALPTAFSLVTLPVCPKSPTPLFLPVQTWNAFGLNNIVRVLSRPIPLIKEVWLDLTPVLGWYPTPLRPAICIQPTSPLESTLVLMRCYHQLPPIKWKADDMLDLYQDVERSDPSRRAAFQQGALGQ